MEKDDREEGEKNRRIELGRWVRKIHGKTMEIRRKHVNVMNTNTGIKRTGNQIFLSKTTSPFVSYKLPFYRKEGKLWRSVASGLNSTWLTGCFGWVL